MLKYILFISGEKCRANFSQKLNFLKMCPGFVCVLTLFPAIRHKFFSLDKVDPDQITTLGAAWSGFKVLAATIWSAFEYLHIIRNHFQDKNKCLGKGP